MAKRLCETYRWNTSFIEKEQVCLRSCPKSRGISHLDFLYLFLSASVKKACSCYRNPEATGATVSSRKLRSIKQNGKVGLTIDKGLVKNSQTSDRLLEENGNKQARNVTMHHAVSLPISCKEGNIKPINC